MWNKIKSFLNSDHIDGKDLEQDQTLKLAIAALLVTVASSDESFGPQETNQLMDIFTGHFGMKRDAAKELIETAAAKSQDAVDMHRFVRVINNDLDNEQRKDILKYAWQMVLADGKVHAHEDHMIRRLGPLLGISRHDSIEIRDKIVESRSRG